MAKITSLEKTFILSVALHEFLSNHECDYNEDEKQIIIQLINENQIKKDKLINKEIRRTK